MADEIDIANDRILADIERRIQAARKTAVERGPEFCSNEDCGDEMPEERRAIGAKICIECAKRAEYMKRLYSR
jgi:RNA polymerase-binding transcription factor DksA